METLWQFALLLIIVIGVPTIGISIVAGAIKLVRLMLGADTWINLRGEAVDVGRNLSGRATPAGANSSQAAG